MFNPTIELRKYNPTENVMETILTKKIDLGDNGFPEVVIWKDETFTLIDWEPNVHAVYEFAAHLKIAYEPIVNS